MVELELAHKKGVSNNRTVTNGPAPVAASHQRLLSMKQSEIQERLIKNKTLLNVVEPTLTNHSLDLFLGILQRRIELDKEALFQFSQLKRDQSTAKPAEPAHIVIAPILMKYSHGCQQVCHIFNIFEFIFVFFSLIRLRLNITQWVRLSFVFTLDIWDTAWKKPSRKLIIQRCFLSESSE